MMTTYPQLVEKKGEFGFCPAHARSVELRFAARFTCEHKNRSPRLLYFARLTPHVSQKRMGEVQSRLDEQVLIFQSDQTANNFRPIFEIFAPRLKAFFMRRGQNDASAEDLVQETLRRVWSSIDSFDISRGSASAWIYRIARNRLIDHLRSSQNRTFSSERILDVIAKDPSQEVELGRIRLLEYLDDAIASLPPEQARIIEDAYIYGWSIAECAERSGVPIGTLKTRARLALQKLRSSVKNRFDYEP